MTGSLYRTDFTPLRALRRPLGAAVLAVGALIAAALPAGAAPAREAAANVVTDVRPATLRLAEDENGLIVFVNKSRAICAPRTVCLRGGLQWLDSGQQGDPPTEPAASNQGVKPVRFTDSTVGSIMVQSANGPNLPVDVWRFEDDVDGIDCSATDGPGAAQFAVGVMTFRNVSVNGPNLTANDTSVEGKIVDGAGQRYRYLIRYQFRQLGDHDPVFTPTIRLVPTR